MTIPTFRGAEELTAAVGRELGVSAWLRIDQARINTFAEATGDDQWIHVDAERAAGGPFGGTIAHGFLLLSLLPYLAQTAYRVDGFSMKVNYGLDRVRFVSPVRSGDDIQLRAQLTAVEGSPRGLRCIIENTIELREGTTACVARGITLLTS